MRLPAGDRPRRRREEDRPADIRAVDDRLYQGTSDGRPGRRRGGGADNAAIVRQGRQGTGPAPAGQHRHGSRRPPAPPDRSGQPRQRAALHGRRDPASRECGPRIAPAQLREPVQLPQCPPDGGGQGPFAKRMRGPALQAADARLERRRAARASNRRMQPTPQARAGSARRPAARSPDMGAAIPATAPACNRPSLRQELGAPTRAAGVRRLEAGQRARGAAIGTARRPLGAPPTRDAAPLSALSFPAGACTPG